MIYVKVRVFLGLHASLNPSHVSIGHRSKMEMFMGNMNDQHSW